MRKYLKISGYILLIMLFVGGALFFWYGVEPVDKTAYDAVASRSPQKTNTPKPLPETRPTQKASKAMAEKPALKKRPIEKPAEAEKDYPKYIEDIKEQVYEKQIESVDQIPLLDDIVQTGDKDVRQFWGDGWSSVDDWKREENGFTLEKNEDGDLVFNPGPATARKYTFFESPKTYTYDPEHKEFVSEVDYYGKTIYNVVKFINDDVLAMMTISGQKVSLNLYQKDAGQLAATREAEQEPPAGLNRSGLTR
ncbi:MAG: hypothetical protein ACLFNS_14355 [Desulfobacterales bacterium]